MAIISRASLIPLDNFLGTWLIGLILSAVLFGITCLQIYLYFTKYCLRDRGILKAFVRISCNLWKPVTTRVILTLTIFLTGSWSVHIGCLSPRSGFPLDILRGGYEFWGLRSAGNSAVASRLTWKIAFAKFSSIARLRLLGVSW
ncbi:hypothetical protein R3P38DRAFT_3038379 [Favolaschia claudopus]|uniref:ATP synthase F0 subunit 8 n=1 Tax=Favolaschia claudopus TaxID=2862362 RepID=A0AAW0ACE1_9AGAR